MRQILELAEAGEREASQALAASRAALEKSERQLAELLRYRDEYAQRPQATSVARLRDAHLFLERLNDAVRQQRALVEQAREDFATRTRGWQEQRGRMDSLTKLVARLEALERRADDRREQRHADELTARRLAFQSDLPR
jgi:flagellar FliJ protein